MASFLLPQIFLLFTVSKSIPLPDCRASGNFDQVSPRYKKDFVEEFKASCKKLGVSQSEVIRAAMEETIRKAEDR
ncbi:hypothetical protein FYJ51_00620 [Erysipelotrichaceae bacterium Oil+RF-744-GAM-WT-6]|uniref:Ribbon-helix-helix protein CopG domain-containing protein n=1 Tax=Stecheria intestinalis TaxID=2606630 RepID=A0A7X2NPY5_9FIRM|nr:hypothetical protein [Stecheria intestinalis]